MHQFSAARFNDFGFSAPRASMDCQYGREPPGTVNEKPEFGSSAAHVYQ
jgi:hypothetical protein